MTNPTHRRAPTSDELGEALSKALTTQPPAQIGGARHGC